MLGSCLCGAVAYEVDELTGPIVHCHCQTCRKAHAAPFATTAGVNRAAFRCIRGKDSLAAFESTPGKLRHFCRQCGSHLMAEWRDRDQVILRVATLDDDPKARPVAHIWTAHDVDWLHYGSDLTGYPERP